MVALVEECREGSSRLLHWAKTQGQREIEETDMATLVDSDWSTTRLKKFSAELYSVLLSKTVGDYRAAVLAVQPSGASIPQRGFEAWRAINYEAAPLNQARAETLRRTLVQAKQSKDVKALKHSLLIHKALVAQYNEVAASPMSEETKSMGLKAIMTPELHGEYLRCVNPPSSYADVYKYIQAYVGRITYDGGEAGEPLNLGCVDDESHS